MVWKAEDKAALPSCTTEGVNYLLECVAWRREGKRRVYNGETGRSPYQRGKEHTREIEEGVLSHPLLLHFWEEHNGRRQKIMMRTISVYLTVLEYPGCFKEGRRIP